MENKYAEKIKNLIAEELKKSTARNLIIS